MRRSKSRLSWAATALDVLTARICCVADLVGRVVDCVMRFTERGDFANLQNVV